MLNQFVQQTCEALLRARYLERYLSWKEKREGGGRKRNDVCREEGTKEGREGGRKEWRKEW